MKIRIQAGIWISGILIIFAAVLCLSGCLSYNTLPQNKGNDCLLLIPVERDDETLITNEWGFKYTIYIKELDKQVYIDPNADFKMFVMKPGKYHITEFRIIRNYYGKIEERETFRLPIEMKTGYITILPFKLIVSWREGDTPYENIQWVSIGEVTIGDKRKYIEKVKEYTNYDQWKFSYIE